MSEEKPSVIKQCEEKYPETTAEFKKILKEQYEIFCRKQLNYGPDNISGGTALKTNDDIRFSLMGLFFRKKSKYCLLTPSISASSVRLPARFIFSSICSTVILCAIFNHLPFFTV
jgi:hypothetical protein